MSNQTLDGILRKVDILKSIASPDGNPFIPGNISVEEAAAAIQKLVKEVIGENAPGETNIMIAAEHAEQRRRAKERGLL